MNGNCGWPTMESLKYPSDHILNEAIGEIKEPVVFQGILNDAKGEFVWKLFEWNLSKLAEKFGDTKLPFRVGYNAGSTVNYSYLNRNFFILRMLFTLQ